MPGCCLISSLKKHLSLAFLTAAKFSIDGRVKARPQLEGITSATGC